MGRRLPLILLAVAAGAALVWTVLPSAPSLGPAAVAADDAPQTPGLKAELKTTQQKGSYAFGYNVASRLKQQVGPDAIDVNAFLLGMQEAFAGKKASLNEADCNQAFKAFQWKSEPVR
jgi:hypothetical protein